MTQILVTLEDASWLSKILSAISMLKGVLRTEVVKENETDQKEKLLEEICGSWEGNESADEIIKNIYEARTSNMKPVDL